MFFPIGDTNIKRGSPPIMTYLLIVLNVAVFLYMFFLPPLEQQFLVDRYASIPTHILSGRDGLTILTSMFLHGGWMHLIGNMMFMWIFADNIEATIGSFKFLLFYLMGGIVACLTHSFMNPFSAMPTVGASGAIAACLGAYIVMFPGSQVRVLFLLFLTSFRVPAIFFLGFWIVQQLLSGFGSLSAVTTESTGVAYWAHIGGFVFGVLSGFIFRPHAKQMQMEED